MSGRIRGHYRIESTGLVTPLADVNAVMKPFSVPLSRAVDKLANRQSRIMKMSIVGLTLFSVCAGGILVLPQFERSMIASQSMKIASGAVGFFPHSSRISFA